MNWSTASMFALNFLVRIASMFMQKSFSALELEEEVLGADVYGDAITGQVE